MHFKKLCDI